METEGSSPHSQAPATCPYPEPAQSSPHTLLPPPALYKLLKFHVPKRVSLFPFLWHETSSRGTPPGDPSGGVVYLQIVLSPEEASRPYECFITGVFYGEALLAPRPTPNLEGQGIPFSLCHHLWPVWHRRPYQ